jgi:P-type conjugative transfer protein TrbJ
LWASVASAQLAVIDAGNIAQSTKNVIESTKQTLKQIEQYQKQLEQINNEYKMIKNQYDQITNQATQIKNQVQNLQRLPGSIQASLTSSGNKMTALLGAFDAVNRATTQATQQFDSLFPKNPQPGDSAAMLNQRLAWLQARRSSASMMVETSALGKNITDQFDKMRILLARSFTAQGNLDAQQIAHQQQALQATIQLQQQTMDAALANAKAREEAEKIAVAQMQLQMTKEATAYIQTDKPYEVSGKTVDYERFYPAR